MNTDEKYDLYESWPLKTEDYFPFDHLIILFSFCYESDVKHQVVNENVNVRDVAGQSSNVSPKYWLAFRAAVPTLGFISYVISSDKPGASVLSKQLLYTFEWSQTSPIEIGSGSLKLVHSENNGKLMQYINSRSLVNISIEQSYIYFTGYDRSDDFQASRAYFFRPNGSFPVLSEEKGTTYVVLSGLVASLKLLGGTLADHTFLFLGSGEAGTGIAELIALKMSKQLSMLSK